MQLVLDLNVLVSAVIAHGSPARVFDLWRRDETYELIICPRLLADLEEVLAREKLAAFLTPGEAMALLTVLRERATVHADPLDPPALVRDPDDDYIVALAVDVGADAVVSGDRDLLDLDDPPVAIWSPRDALRQLHLPDS